MGYYTHTVAGPRILLQEGKRGQSTETIMFHEYVHHLMRGSNQFNYPLWYDEGFAEVLAATTIKGQEATIGNVSKARGYELKYGKKIKLSELLKTNSRVEGNKFFWAAFYAKAWFFVHYLQISPWAGNDQLKPQTADYLYRVSQGEDPLLAFKESFLMTAEEMDEILDNYQKRKRIVVFKLQLPDIDRVVRSQKLSRNESIFLLANLARLSYKNDLALEILKDLDEKDKKSASGMALKAVLENENKQGDGLGYRDLALAMSPEDPKVLHNVAKWDLNNYFESEEKIVNETENLMGIEEKVLRAIALDPENIENYELLWKIAAEQDEPVKVAKNMMLAYQLDHTSVKLNFEIGIFLANQQKPELAVDFLERAYNWSHQSAQRESIKKILDEVQDRAVSQQ